MALKLLSPQKPSFLHFIFILMLFFSATNTSAQCAGTDNNLTVCDIPDSSSKSIDLNVLLGSHTTGGIWTDDLFSEGLDINSGILNAQKISKSGVYTYTYTVDNGIGCKDSAIITVTIGGYSGISSPNISACNDDLSFNLFQGFNGNYLSPQSNGLWSDNEGTGALNNNLLNANKAGLGTHSFTYTIPAIDTCPAQSSTVNVTVFRAPVPGTPSFLLLCSSDSPTFNTNFNLNDLLTGEDSNGLWTEISGTSEISDTKDFTVNIKNIYDTLGSGVYSFTYTVLPTNPICAIKKATVSIIIENLLDFTGAKLVVNSDICESEITTAQYNAVLNQGTQNIPNGSYSVTYTVTGPLSPSTKNIIADFNDGVLFFPIPSSNFQQIADYTIRINKIVSVTSLGACTNIIGVISAPLHVHPLPKINTGTLTINPVCKGFAAPVTISGNTNLTDGNYKIDYELSGSNTAVAQQLIFSVTSGVGNFAIPANLIPTVGNTTILISNITNLTTGCTNSSTLSKVFVIKPLTDLANFKIDIKDVCKNQPVSVGLSGLGILTNVTLNYKLTGANSVVNQSVTIPVNSGNASFIIPAGLLINTGTTSLVVTYIIDNGGGCVGAISNDTKSFAINAVPNDPIANGGIFCKNDKKTIANLTPSGTQYQWFDSLTSTTILSTNTLLVTKSYYVKEVNSITGCESSRVMTNVVINEVQTPILIQDGQNFCGLDNPILQNLTDKVTTNGTLTWFDAPTNGNQLIPTTLLKDGITYYGFDYSSATNCYSDALVVTASLSNCNVTPEFFIPDGFSPNGDGVNDTFRIPDIEFIYPNFSLEIYSRYGNLMFTGNKNKPNWDGKSSNSNINIDGIAPNGIYFYVINFNKDNVSPKQGRLYLNR